MRLKRVHIYSHKTAEEAEKVINDAIDRCDESDIWVNYELMVESTLQVLNNTETYYTVIIHEYDPVNFDEEDE